MAARRKVSGTTADCVVAEAQAVHASASRQSRPPRSRARRARFHSRSGRRRPRGRRPDLTQPRLGPGQFHLLEHLGGTAGVLADGAHGGGIGIRHASSVAAFHSSAPWHECQRDHAMAPGRRQAIYESPPDEAAAPQVCCSGPAGPSPLNAVTPSWSWSATPHAAAGLPGTGDREAGGVLTCRGSALQRLWCCPLPAIAGPVGRQARSCELPRETTRRSGAARVPTHPHPGTRPQSAGAAHLDLDTRGFPALHGRRHPRPTAGRRQSGL